MNASILVVFAGLLFCAYGASGQQSSGGNSALNPSSGNPPSASGPPSVSVGPDQVRPADAATQPAAPTPKPPAAAPTEPVPNPNAPASAPKSAGNPKNTIAPTEPKAPSALYVIGSLDVLEIRVWNDPKLTSMYPVRPDGMISLPLVGEIKADGQTVVELTDTVRQKLTAVMNDPRVNIQVTKINSKRVFVFGGVQRPGEMALYENMTVLDALSNVGFKDFANPKKITIMRGTQMLHFNYREVSKGRHMEQNIYLQNGDRIFVPE